MESKNLKRLVECALLIAIGTVLSLLQFKGPWVLGGGITICSMLPLVMISHRHGSKWGILSALVFSVIQLLVGLSNVQYAPDALAAVGIILLDYVLAFTVIGFSACFNGIIKDRRWAIVLGIVMTFSVRYVCHFLSGVLIWEAIAPNAVGWASVAWSVVYNGSFMVPEIIITSIAAFATFVPLKKYWLGEDMPMAKVVKQ